MHRSRKIRQSTYNLKNCFGFDENEVDLSLWNNSSVMNDTTTPLEFQQNKPYRLALYVKPTEQRRLYKTNASVIVKNTVEKVTKSKKNDSKTNFRLVEKSEVKKTRKKETRVKNIMLFDENTKPKNISQTIKKTPEKNKSEKNVTITELPSTRKNILREINTKPVTKTKQSKVRRSYERKFKEKESEIIPEPPSDEIIKDLEVKKLARTKIKKTAKEEQEFEKWANNMNSDFNDVDKFELSIAYD